MNDVEDTHHPVQMSGHPWGIFKKLRFYYQMELNLFSEPLLCSLSPYRRIGTDNMILSSPPKHLLHIKMGISILSCQVPTEGSLRILWRNLANVVLLKFICSSFEQTSIHFSHVNNLSSSLYLMIFC